MSAFTAAVLPCLTASRTRTPVPPAAPRLTSRTPRSSTGISCGFHAHRSELRQRSRRALAFRPAHGGPEGPHYTDLDLDPAGAERAELVDLAAELVGEVDHQVRDRRFLRRLDVTVALQQARAAADDGRRDVEPRVRCRSRSCRCHTGSANDRAASRRRRASSFSFFTNLANSAM